MSHVVIDKYKLDMLATVIGRKSGETVPMTIAEMTEAVEGIEQGGSTPTLQAKTYTVDSAGTATVTADTGYDGLSEVEVSVPQGEMYAYYRALYKTVSNVRKWELTPIAEVVIGDGYGTPGFIDDETIEYGDSVTYNAIAKNTSVTPTESSQTIGGANYMMEGAVTVNAIPSTYVGSGITRRYGADITSAGNAVMVPEGYYDDDWTCRVADKNTQVVQGTTRTNASTLTAIGAELTVSTTGTYDIYYSCFRTNTSSSYTWATQLYINGTAYGTAENTTWTNNQQNTHLSNISLTAGDKLRVYGRNTRGTSYYVCAPTLAIVEA